MGIDENRALEAALAAAHQLLVRNPAILDTGRSAGSEASGRTSRWSRSTARASTTVAASALMARCRR
jgi:hypothetical protein